MNARQAIIDAIAVRLEELTIANGYASDAGDKVFTWHPENIPLEFLPAIVVRDVTDTATLLDRERMEHELRVNVVAAISGDATIDAACRELLSDLVRVLFEDPDRTYNDVCDSIFAADGGSIQIEQTTDKAVGTVTLPLSARYVTARGDWRTKI